MAPALAADIQLIDDGRHAGYMTLGWPDAPGHDFTLEKKTGAGWKVVYEGADRASTLSGLGNGTYRFRLSVDGGTPGKTVAYTIAHHPMDRAWAFFAAGAVMFIALIGLIVAGTRTPLPKGFPDAANDGETVA